MDLMKMKEAIEQAKIDKARLEGQRDNLHKQLKTDFGCDDVAAAKRKLNALDRTIDKDEAALSVAIKALNDNPDYDWGTT